MIASGSRTASSVAKTEVLTSVKKSVFRRPVFVAAGAASLGALLVVNVAAVYLGADAPWLLGTVVIADMVAVGIGVLVTAREVLLADTRSEASDARLASIVDSAMDAIITVDAGQRIVFFNRAAEQVFRCQRWEALGAPLERFIPERFRAGHRAHVETFGRTGVTGRKMGDVTTLWGLRADGEEFPLEAAISQSGEPGQRFYTVILRDITLRKQGEDALRAQQKELRELSARVLEAREEEKTLIARELHDELGQLLTALKMDLAWLRERLPAADAELAAKTAQMNALLDKTVASVRRISAELRPLMLDDLGLHDAIAWLTEDFSARSGVECRLEIPADGELDGVERSVATTLYRVLQESLTNIARHARARHAWVVLGAGSSMLQLEIEDDGRGIAEDDLLRPRSLGLKGMRERVLYLGGAVEIGRAPRGGTRVLVRVPRLPAHGPAS